MINYTSTKNILKICPIMLLKKIENDAKIIL